MTPAHYPPWYSHLPYALLMFCVFCVVFPVFLAGGIVWAVVEMWEGIDAA